MNKFVGGSIPAEDLEVVVWVGDTLPDALKLGLHAHGEGYNDPAALHVDGPRTFVGNVAQNQHLNGVVGQGCIAKVKASVVSRSFCSFHDVLHPCLARGLSRL
jgi:hypothetical protein